ncbi:hypothetical protein [Mycolicibacterium frederiksbergense]|uniref:Uncharacterized protein n=1 Tax=Mycolicibacterium frederiksbergense TaxID=117567 RepID=A0A6H0SBQ4_9MYCO|nr:hypothetical protein [Mycolicibacterium frederiksbergense]QIV83745.1 hypothetical protein EXE63_24790 [Mycolicibacterium frederiksbergense]
MPAPRLWSSRPRPRPARFPPRVRPGAAPVAPVLLVVVRVVPVLVVARVLLVVVRVAQAVPVRPAVRVGPEPEVPAVPVHRWQAARPLRVEHPQALRWRMPRALRAAPRPESWIPPAHRSQVPSVMVRRWQMPRPMSARVACRAPVVAAVVRRVAE